MVRDPSLSPSGKNNIYEMRILFNDITQEEEERQKKLQEEAEKRKRTINIYQFYQDKPKVKVGSLSIDPQLDLWTLRGVIDEKLMKGGKQHFHFIMGSVYDTVIEDQEPFKRIADIITRSTENQDLILGIRNVAEEFYVKCGHETLFYTNKSQFFITKSLSDVR